MSDQTVTQETQPQTAPAAAEPPKPELTINDLAALRAIVEIATQRGAFKAQELTLVGSTYDKLSGFLTSMNNTNKG
jgi:hypothetical protein